MNYFDKMILTPEEENLKLVTFCDESLSCKMIVGKIALK